MNKQLPLAELTPELEQFMNELNDEFPNRRILISPVLVDENLIPRRRFIVQHADGRYASLNVVLNLEQLQDKFVDADALLRAVKEAIRIELAESENSNR